MGCSASWLVSRVASLAAHFLLPIRIMGECVVLLVKPRRTLGSLVIEQIFALPGIGRLAMLSSLEGRDYTTVSGVNMVVEYQLSFVVMFNVIIDISYSWLDPRIRYA